MMPPTTRNLLQEAIPRTLTTRSDTIPLTWRDKLVGFGLIMGLATFGMVVAAIVLVCVLFLLHDTVGEIAPRFWESDHLPS